MNKQNFILLSGIAICLGAFGAKPSMDGTSRSPNVLVILVDDPALTYTIQLSTNLACNDWKTNGVEFVGSVGFSNVWKNVTN